MSNHTWWASMVSGKNGSHDGPSQFKPRFLPGRSSASAERNENGAGERSYNKTTE